MNRQPLVLALLITAVLSQMGSLQVKPLTPTLFAKANYQVSYYTVHTLPANAIFLVDLTQTYITVPNGALNVTATVQNQPVTGATASCENKICTLNLNNAVSAYSNLTITIGSLTNPYFMVNQPVTTKVTFNSSYNENLSWTIYTSYYTLQTITLNSMQQSNYGVGNTNVTYSFNLTLPMTPANPQLAVTFPSQVGIGNLQTTLSYYSTIQNISPFVSGSIAFFPITASYNAQSGTLLLTLSGLINPQSIGSSDSFSILLQLSSLPSGGSCSSCQVAVITTGLIAKSTVPGNVITLSLGSTNSSVGQTNNLTVYSQLFASIPQGGKYQITLPSTVKPVLPVSCNNIYAFSLTSSSPSCTYDPNNNTVSTNNFYFSGIGNVVFGLTIVNPPDNKSVQFTFQTFDAAGNMIGSSTSPTTFSAVPLNLQATATKNVSTVDSPFKLTVNAQLSLALASTDRIKVILPQASYTTANITCASGGIAIICSASIDPVSSNLTISMAPPCSQCTSGSSISFSIDNLISPSYVNSYSQSVVIQTTHNSGVVQELSTQIPIVPAILSAKNYNRTGSSQQVGSSYTMNFQFTITPYVTSNGGQLVIDFTNYDTYVPVVYTASTYSYPTTATITDQAGNRYTNSLIYNTATTPNYLTQIVIQICGSNPCSGYISIAGLVRGYFPLTSSTQTLTLMTSGNSQIAQTSFSVLQFTPVKASNPLALSLTNSVTTLPSSYSLTLVSPKVPVDNTITIVLPSLNKISGGCFGVDNSSLFNAVITCSVLNTTAITLSLDGDITPMMVEYIALDITITNVINPPTVQPLTYKVNTYFNSVNNQQFTTVYSIQNALPLSVSYSRSNNTYAQPSTLTLTLPPSTNINYNQIKLSIPTALMTVSTSSNYLTTTNNSFFLISQIYNMTNNSVLINIINPSSTNIAGDVVFSMLLGGYLTAEGAVSIGKVGPAFLGLSATSNNRVVGAPTDVVLTINRVNPFSTQKSYQLTFSNSVFNLAGAQYNGAQLTLPLSLPISSSTITITNLQNLLSIPETPITAGLTLWSIDTDGNKVAQSQFNSANLAPNTPSTGISYSYVRSSTTIGGLGSLTISYTPRFPTVAATMTILLPQNQMSMLSSACQSQTASGLSSCQVLSSNSSAITLTFSGQTQTILTNVTNLQPNSNNLTVLISNSQNQLVEMSSEAVTPAIQLSQLTISGTSSNQSVATNLVLTLSITSQTSITNTSKLVINFSDKTYLQISQLNTNSQCKYTINSVEYSNCLFTIDNQGWISQINITNLGPNTVAANTPIKLTVTTTNAWTAALFLNKKIDVFVCSSDDSYLSQGSLMISSLNSGLTNFVPTTITALTSSQSTPIAAANNNLTFAFSLPVAIPQSTTILLAIPKSTYTISTSSLQSTMTLSSSSQNSTHYLLYFSVKCAQTGLVCMSANSNYSLTFTAKNNNYLPLISNDLNLQIGSNSNSVSSVAKANLALYTPMNIGTPIVTRTNNNAYQATIISLTFSNPGLQNYSLVISPLTLSSNTLQLINSPTFVGLSNSQTLTYSFNSSGYLIVNLVNMPTTGNNTVVTLKGNNNFLVPTVPEQYLVTLADSQYIYYQSTVTPLTPLQPYQLGVNLQRIVTTVSKTTDIYLNGQFPQSIPAMTVAFNGQNYSITQQQFNISLGTVVNSDNVSDTSSAPILISNPNFIAFQSSLLFTPQLTPQNLTTFTQLNVPSTLNISQQTNLTLTLSNYTLTSISLSLPSFFLTVDKCCIDTNCSQTNIASCKLQTIGSNNNIELTLKTSQNISNAIFTVTAIGYQAQFSQQAIISTGLPSAQATSTVTVAVQATQLVSTLSLSSWMVNTITTYTLYIQPIKKIGYIGIQLPPSISNQLINQTASFELTIDGSISTISLFQSGIYPFSIPVTTSNNNITLKLSSILNPSNSQPYNLSVQQSVDNHFNQIYGRKDFSIAMTQFEPITVTSVERNATKIGVPVTITANIICPNYTDQMLINFPISQVYTGTNCTATVNGQNINCQVLNSSAILLQNVQGNAVYTIDGLFNQKSFSLNAIHDLVQVNLGYPYTRASTIPTTTTYVDPKLTLGTITLQTVQSTNNVLLNPTTVSYNFTIQNINNINGFRVSYAAYFYYIPTTVSCKINQKTVKCVPEETSSVFIIIDQTFTSDKVSLEISGLINYVRTGNWSIVSLQQTVINNQSSTYSDVDVYISQLSGVTPMTTSPLSIRVMFPNNYAQTSPVSLIILIDNAFPALMTRELDINVTIPEGNCQVLTQNYQQTINLQCTFPSPITATLKTLVYHPLYNNITLASSTKQITILPTPTDNCNNQQCDYCSSYNGAEYCFSCREGLYSSNGQCVSNCPQGQFPYTYGICQECYPQCSNCFGYSSSQCLDCYDSALVLNSGTCQTSCPQGSFSYQGDCVQHQQCTSVSGCRRCSGTGFCYQCLPDYINAPQCKYSSPIPPVFMIYILAPFALLTLVTIIIAAAKCGGTDSVLSQTIFSVSFLELIAWILTVPITPSIASGMVLLSFLALRFIISIVAYEVHYRQNLGELSQKLLEEESNKQSQKQEKKEQNDNNDLDNWKSKFARFMAHFNGPDAYELLQSKIAQPVLTVKHHQVVHILFMINRWLVGFLMIYMFTAATFGDSVIMPAAVIVCGGVLTFSRLLTWDKFKACLLRCRS